jgi:hypothetical protein
LRVLELRFSLLNADVIVGDFISVSSGDSIVLWGQGEGAARLKGFAAR